LTIIILICYFHGMKYTIGLDLGTTSVGWAVINNDANKIEDLGVRIFESAENPKNGNSLAEPRRLARSARRRLARRGYRLEKIKGIFVTAGYLTRERISELHAAPNDPYSLRAAGTKRLLNDEELFIAIYHLAKRRGYKSNRKNVVEKNEDGKDDKQVLGGIKANQELLKNNGFRTVGEMLSADLLAHRDVRSFEGVRNKPGSYKHSVSREMLLDELEQILLAQVAMGNSHAALIKDRIVQAVSFQRPFASGETLQKLVGNCEFEKGERRAAKATLSFQYFRLLQSLNHLEIEDLAGPRRLSEAEKKSVVDKAFSVKDINYEQMKKWLNLSSSARFKGVRYFFSRKDIIIGSPEELEKLKDECEKKTKFPSLRSYHELGKAIGGGDPVFWDLIKSNRQIIDAIAEVLTLYKTDEDIKDRLSKISFGSGQALPSDLFRWLSSLSFSGFGHLSLKALTAIIPHLEAGKDYYDAIKAANPQYGKNLSERRLKLAPIAQDDRSITNPVVRRSVAQAIKVVNAIIDRHGSPTEVHVELGRDLSRDIKERRDIEKKQEEGAKKNERAVAEIKESFKFDPKPQDIVKYKLWKEQNCKCAYSGKAVDDARLFDDGYAEIDHIIPFSRSFDDSYSNKVVVLTAENREKLNKLPYECFGGDEDRWQEFQNLVATMSVSPRKKDNLLLKRYDGGELTARTLNDSRYLAKYLKSYIEETLLFADGASKRPVLTVNGMATAYLRKRWGLNKDRQKNDRHHALDAAVVAVVSFGLVQRVAHYSKIGEVQSYLKSHKILGDIAATEEEINEAKRVIAHRNGGGKDPFPQPWNGFSGELERRVDSDELFVSRMPRRKVTGSAHADTLRSPKLFGEGKSTVKKPLTGITLKVLEANRSTIEPKLFEEIRKRLVEFGDDPKKAFAQPFYKTQNDGRLGPVVRSLKIVEDGQKSGLLINDSKALVDRSSMVRVDVFSKVGKKKREYFFVPVYAHQTTGDLPMGIATFGKNEKDWPRADESYDFEFSLSPGDLLSVKKGENEKYWHYVSADISSASFTVESHDRSEKIKSMGIKTLDKMEKYVVGVLGDRHKVNREQRQAFSIKA
jgi:CRISPR-associated endonuclease Csn1